MKHYFLLIVACFLFADVALAFPPLEAYGRLPEIEQMQLSPSGKRYAFIASTGEKRRIGVVENGKPLFAGELGDIKTRGIEWVGEDRLLVTVSTTFDSPLEFTAAYELCTVLNIDLRSGKIASIFEKNKRIAPVMLGDAGTRYIDGQPYKYFIGMAYGRGPGTSGYFFDGDHRNLYRANLESGEIVMQSPGGDGPSYQWAVGASGDVLAHSVYENASGIWRLYAGQDNKKLLLERTSTDGRRDTSLLGSGRSPNTVLVSETTDNTSVVEEVSLADGSRAPLFELANVGNVLRDRDSGLAIGATLSDAPYGAFFDAILQARFAGMRKAFPGQRIEFSSYSRNFDHMIALTDGGSDSGTYWLVDIAGGAADPIGRMYPEVRSADVGQVSWVNYKSGDGQKISGTLTLPPGRKPEKLPLIVLALEDEPGTLGFDWRAQAFVAAGYAVFEPGQMARNDAASGSIDYAQLVMNISNGVQALAAQKIVDPARTCIVGINMGGYSAMAAVTLKPGAYRCSVAVAAPLDLPANLQWLIDRHRYDSNAVRSWRSQFGPDKDLGQRSPAHFARQASAPVLLIHGKDDLVVPFSQSEKMASALRSADKPVELVALDGEDHWLSRGESRKTMLKAAMEFVKKYNPPE